MVRRSSHLAVVGFLKRIYRYECATTQIPNHTAIDLKQRTKIPPPARIMPAPIYHNTSYSHCDLSNFHYLSISVSVWVCFNSIITNRLLVSFLLVYIYRWKIIQPLDEWRVVSTSRCVVDVEFWHQNCRCKWITSQITYDAGFSTGPY